MRAKISVLVWTICMLVASDRWPADVEAKAFGQFEDATLVVVYSATDEDAQIIISGGSEEPLRTVKVSGPRGLRPMSWKSKDGAGLGQADFQFETPEPTLEELMAAYPAGMYRFVGRTVENARLKSDVELSYDLLPEPQILFPEDGDSDITVDGLLVEWNPVRGAAAIRLEIEDEETEVALKVDLPGDADRFEVPNNWLQPGTEYVLDIKAIADNGNQTVTDLRFTTEE